MKMVSCQSWSHLVLCVPLNYITFFMVSDLTFSTVIYYEDGKFPIEDHVFLIYLTFFMISNLTYSTVMCYEDRKYPFIDTLVSVCL